MENDRNRWTARLVLPGLILFSLLMTVLLSFTTPMQNLKLGVTDQLFELRGPIPIQDSSVVIVAISQQADQEIPQKYPWPTDLYANLVNNLDEAGVRAIGFDVIFDKTDNYSLSNDSAFAEAIMQSKKVILGASVQSEGQGRGQGSSSQITRFVRPHQLLRQANENPLGLVRTYNDLDSAIRKYILSTSYNGERYLSLGLEVLKLFKNIAPEEVSGTPDSFKLGPFEIPWYSNNLMAINYFGGPGTFPRYSFENVIDDSTVILASEDSSFQTNTFSDPYYGLKQSGVFEDKIVLVGATMPELNDLHSTPFAPQDAMPGVEMHANAIQTILSGKYIHHISPWFNLTLIVLLITLVAWAGRRYSGLGGFMTYFSLGILVVALTIFEFLEFRFILDVISMLIALTVGYVTTQSYEYVIEQREKRRLRNLFSSYVSPTVVEEMVESNKEPELGGDEVYMTAFFSDIQSFSAFSEKLPAKTLVKLINEYLSAMTDILTTHGGTLDKYIGDAIVAFFGAPVPQEDHAYKACVVSQLMQLKLDELRRKWRSEGEKWPEIVHYMRNRIGINTGKMVTGNMGSESRFNYTMMGDNVNLAARCESGAKQFGVYTMVTADTKREAEAHGNRCVFRYLDRIVVKGKTEPVDVYEIMGLREHMSDTQFACKQKFEQAIEVYKRQKWDKAIALFEESRELEFYVPNEKSFIHTNPSLVYLDRCKTMKKNPPPADWNGVYVMKSK
ncbi:CHASE2 domain-containing protein [Fodinibius halophilus]|uniref:Adenylate/guanylate cyclase domain-containing protein n=1 Tax=Fodinibius halophilus TaxID=1736908 RepID=A0A6M1TKZ2_9BACT|nr:adenylate/guanylate cyclase domain-containing protein [Fodinibius halophilus]NGP89140.1 adenylate/guanylate cyclase domain-containing protein [Fodinibius halophilus]